MLRLPAKVSLLLLALLTCSAQLIAWPSAAHAASATIGFNPASSQVGLGEIVKVPVTVSSDVHINTVDVTISYPTGTILGVEANAESSVFTITLFPSTVDNSTGQAHFQVSVPTPGAIGKDIPIGTLVFRGAALGTATLSVISAKVIANDGAGTNVYTGASTGSVVVNNTKKPQYTTTGAQGPIPVVNSTSHPDPSKWYSNRNVTFTWGGGQNDYNWVFDQNADTLPPTTSKGGNTTTTINGVADGVWYFHVRAAIGDNWGPTSTFKVQIDGTPPGSFQLQLEPDPTKDAAALPLITFNAPDTPSGIDHYEIQLDDNAWVTTVSPYQAPQLKAGQHHVTVRAIDRASNTTTASADFNLKPLSPTPKITTPGDNYTLALGDDGKISGTAPANSSVQLYADNQFIVAATADKDGHFTITLTNQIKPGKYTLNVRAAMANHLPSDFSNSIKGTITGGNGSGSGSGLGGGSFKLFGWQIPWWVIMILYLLLILILLGVLGWLIRKWLIARRDQKLAMQKLELLTETAPPASPQPTNVGADSQTPPAEPGK
jgi:hypothetical protein